MSSYDDDLPTIEERSLLKQLAGDEGEEVRIRAIVEIKDLVIGSKRCKTVFSRVGTIEIFVNLLKEYSTKEILIDIIDCISSFAKCDNKTIVHRLIELGCIEQLFILLPIRIDSIQSSLRCLRSFFLPKLSSTTFVKLDYSNPFLSPIPFVLLCDREIHTSLSLITPAQQSSQLISKDQRSAIEIFFSNVQFFDILIRLLSTSKSTQLSIVEILCSLCINNERQEQLVQKNIIPEIMHLLIQNIADSSTNNKINLISSTNESIIGTCLKFFCSLCYANPSIARQLHQTISPETNETLCEITANLLTKINRPVLISYYASKFFVHLCKSKVLSAGHPSISLQALTTLIHLCTNSAIHQCVYLYIECLETLSYLLNGNSTLHHTTMYTEQFLSQLFADVLTPKKILNEPIEELVIVRIRSSALTLLAVLSSHHEDIKKRIADQENLISTAIDCCRSPHFLLQLAALRLFHGLSRSVHQLRTTFNDSICDILLEAIKSSDLSIMKISSCVISNIVLEFSTCRTRLLNGEILGILVALLTHSDHDICINSIWALRNLSYLATLKIKQDIIQGLTIDRIYSLLEQCIDEQFLICLLSLLRNLFDEKDTEMLLPIFNTTKLLTTLQQLREKKNPEEIRGELDILIDHLTSSSNPSQQRLPSDSVNSSCRTSLFPEYACEEMDQLDC